eukprot:jgi/Tetstr1/423107/TSEL_013877.t1
MHRIVELPLAGTAASPKLHSFVGVLRHHQKKAGGIIKHDTNAVKNLAATQAFTGDKVDAGSSNSPEAPAMKAKQLAKPAAEVPARGWGGTEAMAWGGAGAMTGCTGAQMGSWVRGGASYQ